MNDTKKIDQSGEMIDFRKLILILWRGKWLVLGVAIIAGLIAYLITSFLIPLRYRATAIITVTTPEIRVEFIEKGIVQLARSDELIDLVFAELGITDLEEQQSMEFSAFMEYWGQLELEVRAGDPDLAAETANVWADLVYEGVYDALGTSEQYMAALDEEISQAGADWSEAKQELDDYLAESHLEIYPVELSSAKSALGDYKEIIDRNYLLVSEAQTLESQIEDMDPSDTLNPGIALSLSNLLGGIGDLDEEQQPQIQDADLDLSPAEALDILKRFMESLEIQNEYLRGEATSLENQITELSGSLEAEQSQVDDLILKRDLARKTYAEWVNNLNELEVKQNQVGQTLRISTGAVPPAEADNPGILGISVFTGITTGLVAMIGFMIYDWSRAEERA